MLITFSARLYIFMHFKQLVKQQPASGETVVLFLSLALLTCLASVTLQFDPLTWYNSKQPCITCMVY